MAPNYKKKTTVNTVKRNKTIIIARRFNLHLSACDQAITKHNDERLRVERGCM